MVRTLCKSLKAINENEKGWINLQKSHVPKSKVNDWFNDEPFTLDPPPPSTDCVSKVDRGGVKAANHLEKMIATYKLYLTNLMWDLKIKYKRVVKWVVTLYLESLAHHSNKNSVMIQ